MRSCEACGAEAPPGTAFCGQCGSRLGVGTPSGTATALRRSERKIVTILFADIKGSLALVAGQDPELAGEILGLVTACMTDAVRRHGGLVNQVMGDGIMALFGAPIAMEDHAGQACLAALAMRQAVEEQVRPRVALRVGLGTGEVVVQAVSGDVALHYSAAGEAVHLASRMEQAAEPGQILMTAATREMAGALIEADLLEGIEIKGLPGGLDVYGLVRAAPGHVHGRHERRARLVGRTQEIAQLRQARDRAMAGEGQAIRLTGEAGNGKSRVVREFIPDELLGDWQVGHAQAVPYRRTSYGVVTELLTGLFALEPQDDPALRREKVCAGLRLRGTAAADLLTPLSLILGLQADSPGWTALEGWEKRERTIDATVAALHRLSEHKPLALVVEDVHWLDPESLASAQRLGRTAKGRQMLAVITERTMQGQADGWAESQWVECPIQPLDDQATQELLDTRLVPGPDVEALKAKLIEHTRGNPLFLEECLEALAETGELLREGERFRLLTPVPALRVPRNLRGLLDARVDRLPGVEKDVLQAAAVVGSAVPMDLLRAAAGLGTLALHRALLRLVEAGFLVEGDTAQVSYAFRHGLIRESAYSTILKRGRVRMHGAVLEALEMRPGPSDSVVDLLANHALQAEAWERAADYADRAAVRAFDRYANPEAVFYYDKAIEAAAHLDRPDTLLMRLHTRVRWPLFRLGQVEAIRPHVDEVVRLAEQREGHEALAQALVLRSHVHWLAGEPERALADAETARVLGVEHDDEDLVVRARFQRGLVGLSQCHTATTVADMEAVLTYLGAEGKAGRYGVDARLGINAAAYAARAHAAAGDLGAARRMCDRALEAAEALNDRVERIYAHLADAAVSLAEGHAVRALQAAATADELCRAADVRLLSAVATGFLAEAHVASGDPARALPIARQAVADGERMGFRALQPVRLVVLAETLLALDQEEEAVATAEAAVSLARQVDEGGAEARARIVLARAAQRGGDLARAEDFLADARVLAGRLGLRPLLERIGEPAVVS